MGEPPPPPPGEQTFLEGATRVLPSARTRKRFASGSSAATANNPCLNERRTQREEPRTPQAGGRARSCASGSGPGHGAEQTGPLAGALASGLGQRGRRGSGRRPRGQSGRRGAGGGRVPGNRPQGVQRPPGSAWNADLSPSPGSMPAVWGKRPGAHRPRGNRLKAPLVLVVRGCLSRGWATDCTPSWG